MSIRRFLLLCGVPFALVILSGCGGPRLAPVQGVLTYKGKPVPNVHLDFYPEAGRPSWGHTDAEGRFTLEYDRDNKGALVGKHKVFAKMGMGWEKFPGERPVLSKDMEEFFEKYKAANSQVVLEIEMNTKEVTLAWD